MEPTETGAQDMDKGREIDAEISAILAKELEDAQRKEADPAWNDGYGNIGSDVRMGVYKAENAIQFFAQGKPLRQADIPGILEALDRAVKQFRQDNEDPAGYGVGTLYSVIRGISAIR